MIYSIEENKFYNSLNEMDVKKYEFYREGCLLSLQKIQQNAMKTNSKPIVAKLRCGHKMQGASQNEINQLAEELEPEEKAVFQQNKRIIFEEWRKFKFIRPGHNSADNGSKQNEKDLEIRFGKAGVETSDCSAQKLDYLISNWRVSLRTATFSDIRKQN